jgi:hypothetical protein
MRILYTILILFIVSCTKTEHFKSVDVYVNNPYKSASLSIYKNNITIWDSLPFSNDGVTSSGLNQLQSGDIIKANVTIYVKNIDSGFVQKDSILINFREFSGRILQSNVIPVDSLTYLVSRSFVID